MIDKRYKVPIQNCITLLENVRRRPGLYISNPQEHSFRNYINGLYKAFAMFGLKPDPKIYKEIERSRGWRDDPLSGSLPHMKEKGLSDLQIVQEYATIHCEMWRRMLREIGD